MGGVKGAGDDESDQVGDHQRHDDGVIAGQFEDHHHASDGGADDAGKRRAHADQRVSAGAGRVGAATHVRNEPNPPPSIAPKRGSGRRYRRHCRSRSRRRGQRVSDQQKEHQLDGAMSVAAQVPTAA